MDLLYRAGTLKSYAFSSWIPKWTGDHFPKTISNWRGAQGTFCAGRRVAAHVQLSSSDSTILQISGFAMDTITKIGNVTTVENDLISFINSIRQTVGERKSYPGFEALEDIMLKLPIGNAGRPYSEPDDDILVPHKALWADEWSWVGGPSFDFSREGIASVTSIREMMEFLKKPKTTRESGWKYWATAAAFARRIPQARVCETAKGYLGLVCGDAKVEDQICVFHGGAVPFILRPADQSDSKKTWSLIGECYIHGIMYGEALSWSGIKEEEFCLR